MVNYPLAIYFSSCFEINHFTCKLFNMKNSVLTQVRDYYIPCVCVLFLLKLYLIKKVGMSTPETEFQIYLLISLNSKCIQLYHNLTLRHT